MQWSMYHLVNFELSYFNYMLLNVITKFGYCGYSDGPTSQHQLLSALSFGHSRRILESLNYVDYVRHTNYPVITSYTKL